MVKTFIASFAFGVGFGSIIYTYGFRRGLNSRRAPIPEQAIQQAAHRLADKKCHGCGGNKVKGQAFCKACFSALPRGFKVNLQVMLKRHWVASFNQALGWLHQNRIQPLYAFDYETVRAKGDPLCRIVNKGFATIDDVFKKAGVA